MKKNVMISFLSLLLVLLFSCEDKYYEEETPEEKLNATYGLEDDPAVSSIDISSNLNELLQTRSSASSLYIPLLGPTFTFAGDTIELETKGYLIHPSPPTAFSWHYSYNHFTLVKYKDLNESSVYVKNSIIVLKANNISEDYVDSYVYVDCKDYNLGWLPSAASTVRIFKEKPSIYGLDAVNVTSTQKYEVNRGEFDSYSWSVPNGCSISSTNTFATNITFNQTGTFTISCQVKIQEVTRWIYKTITVRELPKPNLHYTQTLGYAGEFIPLFYLDNTKEYEWIIPNGCEAKYNDNKKNHISVKFPNSGVYKIKVRAMKQSNGVVSYSGWSEVEVDILLKPSTVVYEVSKTHFTKFYSDGDMGFLSMAAEFPFYFIEEGSDAPHPDFLIGSDPQDPSIRYYYMIKGKEELTLNAFWASPNEACEAVYAFPGTGIPAETVTVHYK